MDTDTQAGHLCECCAHCWRDVDGQMAPLRVPAVYVWTSRNGHDWPLCVRCAALWRRNAVEDADLAPLRVATLRP